MTAAIAAAATKRARKPPKGAESTAANLIAGLQFVSIAQREVGEQIQTHCVLDNGWILATDGGISAGCKIEDTLQASPHTRRLSAALKKCQGSIAIVQLSNAQLRVKAGKFSATIPCVDSADMPTIYPDAKIAVLSNAIKAGFAACAPIINESAPEAYKAALLLQANTIVGCNGHLLLEYWHGIDLPPGIMIPKAAAVAIANCEKNLTGFGFTDRSATFHFEDDSFIKTALFNNDYPNFNQIIEKPSNPWPVPADFFIGLDHVLEFAENGHIFFDNNLMKSSKIESLGANYQVDGLTGGMGFNGKYLKIVQKEFIKAAFIPDDAVVFFFSDNARGMLKGLMIEKEKRFDNVGVDPKPKYFLPNADKVSKALANFDSDLDDDIPF